MATIRHLLHRKCVTSTLAHPNAQKTRALGRLVEQALRDACTCPTRRTILTAVGLNPFRQHRRSAADILLVAGALVVCAVLVAWALFG